MSAWVTPNYSTRVLELPLNLSQTELRRNKSIVVARIFLARDQRLELRVLNLAVMGILTPGVIHVYANSPMGLCSVGFYRGQTACSPLDCAIALDQTPVAINPFAACVVETPGTYSVIVCNNTSNIDLSVTVTGLLKFSY